MKISVTVDPTLLRAMDDFIAGNMGADRSKVIDQALIQWSAAQQEEAMIRQYSEPVELDAEGHAWRSARRAAAAQRLSRR
ncbi:MAG: ribbon-helix-helix domain-containing protein [Candidatus Dormibacteria bacterium]